MDSCWKYRRVIYVIFGITLTVCDTLIASLSVEGPSQWPDALILEKTVGSLKCSNQSSDKAVVITDIKPSCGCTVVNDTKVKIAPGASAIIKTVVRAPENSGQQEVSIVFSWRYSGEKDDQVEVYELPRKILDPVEFRPEAIDFGVISQNNGSITKEFECTYDDSKVKGLELIVPRNLSQFARSIFPSIFKIKFMA